jgi:hypothetical protein
VKSTGAVPFRIAYDASRDKTFAWRLSDRNLVEFNLTTGAATAIGETHPSTSHRNQSVRAFFSAPAARCP